LSRSWVDRRRRRKARHHRGLEVAESFVKRAAFVRGYPIQQVDDPPLVLDGHRVELALAFRCQTHVVRAAVTGNLSSDDETFGHELIGKAGNVASGNHQPT